MPGCVPSVVKKVLELVSFYSYTHTSVNKFKNNLCGSERKMFSQAPIISVRKMGYGQFLRGCPYLLTRTRIALTVTLNW